ncbi:HIT domain-containing protein [Polyangium fumosum]|uniref:HIT domain-containing protein n=1 Tax=Polyangium fumosum TaxID=889272 RepID=UPI001E48F7F8|nr:HIT domain-containing protein [Polyangium fumosum]
MSPFLRIPSSSWIASNALAFAVPDLYPVSRGHTLVIPRRLVATWFDATPEEQRALFELVDDVKRKLDAELSPDGYNIGINAGEAAGQTVMHLHVHVIPRYRGDVDDPRGGVRHVIPGKGNYLANRSPPLAQGGTDDPFLAHLAPLFRRAADIAILAAFTQERGLDLLESHVFAALAHGARVRLVTSDYLQITSAQALRTLLDWVGSPPVRRGKAPSCTQAVFVFLRKKYNAGA